MELFLFSEWYVRHMHGSCGHAVAVAVLLLLYTLSSSGKCNQQQQQFKGEKVFVFVTSNLYHLDNLHTLLPFEN